MTDRTAKLDNNFNSSITRVRPLLRQLLAGGELGASRLRKLLELVPLNRQIVEPLLRQNPPEEIVSECRRERDYNDKKLGKIKLEGAFEASVPPPEAFLRHLIEHPTLLAGAWAKKRKRFQGQTRRLRDDLIDRSDTADGNSARQHALLALDLHGSCGSAKQWWAFEGFTEVDCLIETRSFVLFIEGKRTERISHDTDWVTGRHQLSRNLECARQYAAPNEKEFGVLLISEKGEQSDHSGSTRSELLRSGLPHLGDSEAHELLRHFLGELHWQDLREALDLGDRPFPNTSADAVDWHP